MNNPLVPQARHGPPLYGVRSVVANGLGGPRIANAHDFGGPLGFDFWSSISVYCIVVVVVQNDYRFQPGRPAGLSRKIRISLVGNLSRKGKFDLTGYLNDFSAVCFSVGKKGFFVRFRIESESVVHLLVFGRLIGKGQFQLCQTKGLLLFLGWKLPTAFGLQSRRRWPCKRNIDCWQKLLSPSL